MIASPIHQRISFSCPVSSLQATSIPVSNLYCFFLVEDNSVRLFVVITPGGLLVVRRVVVNARLVVARSSTLPFAIKFEERGEKLIADAMAIGLGSLRNARRQPSTGNGRRLKSRDPLTYMRSGGKGCLLMVCKQVTLS